MQVLNELTRKEDFRVFFQREEDTGAVNPKPCTDRFSSRFENNCFTSMCSGSEAGSYVRLIDVCITQLQA